MDRISIWSYRSFFWGTVYWKEKKCWKCLLFSRQRTYPCFDGLLFFFFVTHSNFLVFELLLRLFQMYIYQHTQQAILLYNTLYPLAEHELYSPPFLAPRFSHNSFSAVSARSKLHVGVLSITVFETVMLFRVCQWCEPMKREYWARCQVLSAALSKTLTKYSTIPAWRNVASLTVRCRNVGSPSPLNLAQSTTSSNLKTALYLYRNIGMSVKLCYPLQSDYSDYSWIGLPPRQSPCQKVRIWSSLSQPVRTVQIPELQARHFFAAYE